MQKIHEIKSAVHQLPDKKRYAEFITAVLSVPVLITVLIMNVNNLRKTNPPSPASQAVVMGTTPSPEPTVTRTHSPTEKPAKTTVSPTLAPSPTNAPVAGCKKEVGPVEITSPDEGETVTRNPVGIDIGKRNDEYCEVVWSYRINDDSWSEYIDKSIFLYNLPPGEKTIEVKVKSIASSDQKVLRRTFIIPGTPTTTPTATTSANAAQ